MWSIVALLARHGAPWENGAVESSLSGPALRGAVAPLRKPRSKDRARLGEEDGGGRQSPILEELA
jgi:hypothetical protein